MNRYFIIDRETKTIIDTNALNINDADYYDKYGGTITAVNNVDMYEEAINCMIDELTSSDSDFREKLETLEALEKKITTEINALNDMTTYKILIRDSLHVGFYAITCTTNNIANFIDRRNIKEEDIIKIIKIDEEGESCGR